MDTQIRTGMDDFVRLELFPIGHALITFNAANCTPGDNAAKLEMESHELAIRKQDPQAEAKNRTGTDCDANKYYRAHSMSASHEREVSLGKHEAVEVEPLLEIAAQPTRLFDTGITRNGVNRTNETRVSQPTATDLKLGPNKPAVKLWCAKDGLPAKLDNSMDQYKEPASRVRCGIAKRVSGCISNVASQTLINQNSIGTTPTTKPAIESKLAFDTASPASTTSKRSSAAGNLLQPPDDAAISQLGHNGDGPAEHSPGTATKASRPDIQVHDKGSDSWPSTLASNESRNSECLIRQSLSQKKTAVYGDNNRIASWALNLTEEEIMAHHHKRMERWARYNQQWIDDYPNGSVSEDPAMSQRNSERSAEEILTNSPLTSPTTGVSRMSIVATQSRQLSLIHSIMRLEETNEGPKHNDKSGVATGPSSTIVLDNSDAHAAIPLQPNSQSLSNSLFMPTISAKKTSLSSLEMRWPQKFQVTSMHTLFDSSNKDYPLNTEHDVTNALDDASKAGIPWKSSLPALSNQSKQFPTTHALNSGAVLSSSNEKEPPLDSRMTITSDKFDVSKDYAFIGKHEDQMVMASASNAAGSSMSFLDSSNSKSKHSIATPNPSMNPATPSSYEEASLEGLKTTASAASTGDSEQSSAFITEQDGQKVSTSSSKEAISSVSSPNVSDGHCRLPQRAARHVRLSVSVANKPQAPEELKSNLRAKALAWGNTWNATQNKTSQILEPRRQQSLLSNESTHNPQSRMAGPVRELEGKTGLWGLPSRHKTGRPNHRQPVLQRNNFHRQMQPF